MSSQHVCVGAETQRGLGGGVVSSSLERDPVSPREKTTKGGPSWAERMSRILRNSYQSRKNTNLLRWFSVTHSFCEVPSSTAAYLTETQVCYWKHQ